MNGYDNNNGYGNNGYGNNGYGNRGYNDNGYGNRGYNDNGYNDNGYDNRGYNDNGYNNDGYDTSRRPVRQLNTRRRLLKWILLSLITLGIYDLVFWSGISSDINTIAGRYDGRKTMHYCLMFFLVGWITLGIGFLVWYHNISSRMGDELKRRNINYSFGAADFWLWNVLGTFIIVGPFVYVYKAAKASNQLALDYNVRG